MYFYFPGNYTWSFAVHLALRCGGQIGELDRHLRGLREKGDAATASEWLEAWAGLAHQMEELGDRELAEGNEIAAGERYLRASVYHVNAERQLRPDDPRKLESYKECLATFEKGYKLARMPFERVEVDSPDGILPGYLIKPKWLPPNPPVVIFFDGFDITKEIMALGMKEQFARRGLALLVVDSPGVGEPLRLRNVPSRPDYEVPAKAYIDYLETRGDLDTSRIGVMGVSLGGYYAPRAAAFEPRIKACASWGAILDWGETWKDRWARQSKTTSVPLWQLPWVMGTPDMESALERVKQWTLVDVFPKIKQPFLMVHGENDRQIPVADAYKGFELLGSEDKQLRIFTVADGGGEHCQSDEPQPSIQLIADWMARKLDAQYP